MPKLESSFDIQMKLFLDSLKNLAFLADETATRVSRKLTEQNQNAQYQNNNEISQLFQDLVDTCQISKRKIGITTKDMLYCEMFVFGFKY